MRAIGAALLMMAFAALPAGAEQTMWDSTHAAPNDAARVQIATDLGNAKRVRLSSLGQTLELRHPRLDASGVHYQSAKGYPAPRPALFVSGIARPAMPPNPVPWSAVERLERQDGGFGSRHAMGVAIGFLGGVALASAAHIFIENLGEHSRVTRSQFVAVTLGGAVLGGIVFEQEPSWKQVYPSP